MSRPLRVLSVRQPFASALFGPKPGENRTWRPSWDVLRTGDWLAIHASVSLYVGAALMVKRWRTTTRLGGDIDDWGLWPECPPAKDLPRDWVIGVVRLAGVGRSYNHARQGDRWAMDDDESFYWLFDARRLFPTPIKPPPAGPMAHAGLWLAPPDVVAATRALGCEVPE